MIKKIISNKLVLFIMYILGFTLYLSPNIFADVLSPDDLYCQSDIAIDIDSGYVLYGKNESEKIYPASTTKILTAILTIENLDLNEKITVSQNAVNLTPYGSSVMGVKAGEIFTVEQLLYGLILPSGNDAALVLAESVSGSVDDFVKLMNEKLEELGLNDTHFVNPHGFHDENHYSTATDMANLLRYCLQNETFKKILSTLTYEIPPTNLTSDSRILRSTSRIIDPLYSSMYCEYFIGGKTGYTLEANGTFVGFASKDDKNIIVCTFNGSQNINGLQARFLDAKKIAEYCFDNFSKQTIIYSSNFQKKIYDLNDNRYYLIGLQDDITALIPNDSNINASYDIEINYSILQVLSTSEETSVYNSKVGDLILTTSINSNETHYELVYLGSEDYIQSKTNYIIAIIIVIVILLLLILTLFTNSNKKISIKYIK